MNSASDLPVPSGASEAGNPLSALAIGERYDAAGERPEPDAGLDGNRPTIPASTEYDDSALGGFDFHLGIYANF